MSVAYFNNGSSNKNNNKSSSYENAAFSSAVTENAFTLDDFDASSDNISIRLPSSATAAEHRRRPRGTLSFRCELSVTPLGGVCVALLLTILGVGLFTTLLCEKSAQRRVQLASELKRVATKLHELKQDAMKISDIDELKALELMASFNASQEQIDAIKNDHPLLADHAAQFYKKLVQVGGQHHFTLAGLILAHGAEFQQELDTVDNKFNHVHDELANVRQESVQKDKTIVEIFEKCAAQNSTLTKTFAALNQQQNKTAMLLNPAHLTMLEDVRSAFDSLLAITPEQERYTEFHSVRRPIIELLKSVNKKIVEEQGGNVA